jgi:chromate transporter
MAGNAEVSGPRYPGSTGEVFRAFLKLGVTSFGGPIAHLGYYRDEFVVRRGWIDEAGFADLVALCQFLPGPASSQTGFALGLLRGGLLGAVAAWTAFMLPSAVLLVAFAYGASAFAGSAESGIVHGLKVVAVAVVAQAVSGMARNLVPDRERAAIALAAVLIVVFAGGSFGQIGAIVIGGLAGLVLCREGAAAPVGNLTVPISRPVSVTCLAVFFGLLILVPLATPAFGLQALALFDAFYRAGALVFGGGHVVLPLLQAQVVSPGWVSNGAFLAGYGAAQAIPGPLFTFAAYLGAVMGPAPNGIAGAAIALGGIFLPGLLLVVGMLPFWDAFRTRPAAQAASWRQRSTIPSGPARSSRHGISRWR